MLSGALHECSTRKGPALEGGRSPFPKKSPAITVSVFALQMSSSVSRSALHLMSSRYWPGLSGSFGIEQTTEPFAASRTGAAEVHFVEQTKSRSPVMEEKKRWKISGPEGVYDPAPP